MFDGATHFERKFIVRVSQLDFLQDRERDRINEHDRAINASCVHNQHLLVRLLKAEEAWFSIVECVLVIGGDEVLPALITANSDALLREASILLDIPDLENPVGVDRVDTAGLLIDHHVDDVVVLQRRSCAEGNWSQTSVARNVKLLQLVLGIQIHDLAEAVECLQRLGADTLRWNRELLVQGIDELCHWTIFIFLLDVTADMKRLTIRKGFGDDRFDDVRLNVLLGLFSDLFCPLKSFGVAL